MLKGAGSIQGSQERRVVVCECGNRLCVEPGILKVRCDCGRMLEVKPMRQGTVVQERGQG